MIPALLFSLITSVAMAQDPGDSLDVPAVGDADIECIGHDGPVGMPEGCDLTTLERGSGGEPSADFRALVARCVRARPDNLRAGDDEGKNQRDSVLASHLLALRFALEDSPPSAECLQCLSSATALPPPNVQSESACLSLEACKAVPREYTLYCQPYAPDWLPGKVDVAWKIRQELCDVGPPGSAIQTAPVDGQHQVWLDGVDQLDRLTDKVASYAGCHDIQEVDPATGRVVRQARVALKPGETVEPFPFRPQSPLDPGRTTQVPELPVAKVRRPNAMRNIGGGLVGAGLIGGAAGAAWHGSCYQSWLPSEGCGRTRLVGSLSLVGVASTAVATGAGMLVIDRLKRKRTAD